MPRARCRAKGVAGVSVSCVRVAMRECTGDGRAGVRVTVHEEHRSCSWSIRSLTSGRRRERAEMVLRVHVGREDR
jgi:hypothetical protein